LEEEEEVPVRGCGPEGPRADEQEVSTYSGAPCRHDKQRALQGKKKIGKYTEGCDAEEKKGRKCEEEEEA